MKISYDWLRQYLSEEVDINVVEEVLTDTGLEVEGVEKIETIKGGLEGLLIGKVVEKEKHPNADKLNLTKVDVGNGDLLNIVCGAPNVDAGQKVVVATVGTTIHPLEGEPFKIKRAKIRGEESCGMICAEDEIGLGNDRDGIIVLPEDATIGQLARDYYNVKSDYLIEIGLTPNRADAMSHVGVARDLVAGLKQRGYNISWNWPEMKGITPGNSSNLKVRVENPEACPRYAGVVIEGLKIAPSPDWLQNRLRSIGLSPINNVVDITNFVQHELGQPLHAFDLAEVKGDEVVVKKVAAGTKFTTLDEVERELNDQDLMICNASEPMCIAGVFGGIKSGVKEGTTAIFLESAYFEPVHIRKTARRHGLNTDASFRFERGIDPTITIQGLNRAAQLILEVAGGEITSPAIDIINDEDKVLEPFKVDFNIDRFSKLAGKQIDESLIEQILNDLDIVVENKKDNDWELVVPPYRVDVQRECDVTEEILRIYGYNNIEFPEKLNASLSYRKKPDNNALRNLIGDFLSANGFNEAMSNSLTKPEYHEWVNEGSVKPDFNVEMLNPLSQDLSVMRQTLLFSGLEAIVYNQNRQSNDMKLFEFGNIYHKYESGYQESSRLMMFACGRANKESWEASNEKVDYYWLKNRAENVLSRLGVGPKFKLKETKDSSLSYGLDYSVGKQKVLTIGAVSKKVLKKMDVRGEVFVAEFDWDKILMMSGNINPSYKEFGIYPAVRRDLSLLLDKKVQFEDLRKEVVQASKSELLREVNLFDVYEGKNLDEGKKSYAMSFILRDDNQTLKDKQVDAVMERIQSALIDKFGAELR